MACSRIFLRAGKEHVAVQYGLHYPVVVIHYDRIGLVPVAGKVLARTAAVVACRLDGGLDVELPVGIGHHYVHRPVSHEFLGPGYGCRIQVVEHFQGIFGLAADRSQRRSDVQADHTGSGYAHAHAVL